LRFYTYKSNTRHNIKQAKPTSCFTSDTIKHLISNSFVHVLGVLRVTSLISIRKVTYGISSGQGWRISGWTVLTA